MYNKRITNELHASRRSRAVLIGNHVRRLRDFQRFCSVTDYFAKNSSRETLDRANTDAAADYSVGRLWLNVLAIARWAHTCIQPHLCVDDCWLSRGSNPNSESSVNKSIGLGCNRPRVSIGLVDRSCDQACH